MVMNWSTSRINLSRISAGRVLLQGAWQTVCIALLLGFSGALSAQTRNGFDLTGALVPVDQILSGGPAKDGIPAIDQPLFVTAQYATFLQATDSVLGLQQGGQARAYPLRIMNWHEVVNDQVNGSAFVLTYCPLCGSGVAFDRRVDGKLLDFGVSGLLYNSDVLLYDRQTNSLWSQLLAKSVSGPMKGRILRVLPLTQTTWGDWRNTHPQTQVLSTQTGHDRPYAQDAYPGYEDSPDVMFPVAFRSAGFHPKERVLGVQVGPLSKAYPFVELAKTRGAITDQLGTTRYTVRFDAAHARATAHLDNETQLPAVVSYWFAWYTFHPDTQVFRAPTPPAQ